MDINILVGASSIKDFHAFMDNTFITKRKTFSTSDHLKLQSLWIHGWMRIFNATHQT